jgi:hypothetical protein
MGAEIGTECRDDRAIWGGGDFAGLAFVRQEATTVEACLKQPRFAHAGLAGEQDDPASAKMSRGKHLIKCILLALAPNQIKVNLRHGALLAVVIRWAQNACW